tara:strand:- start:130 stop:825 length:696 start_codon:yes stop_codon:yes gene_type:complete
MSVYTSSKLIELGSAAFRQWRASHSHCKYLHGYQLKAKFTFGCKSLDDKNWCVDFGGLDDLKQALRDQFDHTTVVAGDDPELDTFKTLHEKNIIQLRIMDGGVGAERFAEWVFKTADTWVDEVTEGRCFVLNVTVTEHGDNWASYTKPLNENTTYVDEEGGKTYVTHEEFEKTWKDWQQQRESSKDVEPVTTTIQPKDDSSKENPKAARVGSDVDRDTNFSDPFKGTSWGN